MNNLTFFDYSSPLFSVVVILSLITIISVTNNFWRSYSKKQDSNKLDDFLNDLTRLKDDKNALEVIKLDIKSINTLIYIADLKQKYGKFDEAIKIYLSLLKHVKDKKKYMDILENLGKTYFDAGLFSRAEEVLLQILSRYPKRIDTLNMLLLVYDKLNNYARALDVVSSLEELEEDVKLDKDYYKIKILENEPLKDIQKRSKDINDIFANSNYKNNLFRIVQNFNISYDQDMFNKLSIDYNNNIKNHLDIYINNLDKLDIDILKGINILEEMFNATKRLNNLEKIEDFNLNIARLLNKDKRKFHILFEYVCNNCKNEYPFVTDRCPSCMKLLDTSLILNIGDISDEKINNIY